MWMTLKKGRHVLSPCIYEFFFCLPCNFFSHSLVIRIYFLVSLIHRCVCLHRCVCGWKKKLRRGPRGVFSVITFMSSMRFCCHCIVNTSCHIDTCGALYRVQKLATCILFFPSWALQNHRGKQCLTWFVCATDKPLWVCYACPSHRNFFFLCSYLCDTVSAFFFF